MRKWRAKGNKTHTEVTKQAECESPRQLPKSAVGPCPREETNWPTSEELHKAADEYYQRAQIKGHHNTLRLSDAFFDGAMWMFRNRPRHQPVVNDSPKDKD